MCVTDRHTHTLTHTEHTNTAATVYLPLTAFGYHHQNSHKTQIANYREPSPVLPLTLIRIGVHL